MNAYLPSQPYDLMWLIACSVLVYVAAFVFVRYAWQPVVALWKAQEHRLEVTLNQRLLMDISSRTAMVLCLMAMVVPGLLLAMIGASLFWFVPGAMVGFFLPWLVIRHLEAKRKQRLEAQLVDGITLLASGVRAGLNLLQAIELLVQNMTGPIQQEFAQLLREYQMGLDLNTAMRNTANRVGLQNYRLLFTAIEMHRIRGGDTGESLDRIAESIREIQRLEGKLDAITAQGRTQARMMAIMPVVILFVLYMITPAETALLFTDPLGRLLLLGVTILIVLGFLWIRKIMAVDI